jgi:hypothetical protein
MATEGISKLTTTIVIAVILIVVAAGSVLAFALTTKTGSQSGSVQTTTTNGATNQSSWNKYLGYIPSGYTLAPKYANAPVFSCPSGMTSTQCQQFQQTCGNGVCDPNETCNSCPIDCSISGNQVCDPYTGRAGSPASVCQLTGPAPVPG